jgi:PAS domain S-box-containing protein
MHLEDLIRPAVIHSGKEIAYANQAFCTLVGADTPANLTGRPLGPFIIEPDRTVLFESFEELRNGDAATFRHQLTLDCTDGTVCETIAVSAATAWDGEPKIRTVFLNISQPDRDTSATLGENAIDQAPVGITVADVTLDDEPLTYVNDGFRRITGYSRGEILGQNCRFLQGDATRDEPVAKMRAAIDAGQSVTVELRNYRKDGTEFWNRITLSPVESGDGTVTHYLGFQQNISEMKAHENELLLFETYAEQADSVLFITDADGAIQYVNPAFERITGYSAAEAIGQTPRILSSGNQDEAFYEEFWETITAGETWEAKIVNQTKTGERYETLQRVTPIEDDRGTIQYYVAFEKEITQKQLRSQVLDVLNRVLRHNVRNSVTVIDGYAELLASDSDDVDVQAVADNIREWAGTLESISERTATIRQLIRLLDSDEDPIGMPLSKTASTVERYRREYADAEIDLTIGDENSSAIMYGAIFEVALKELIENAIEHNDQPTPRIEIAIRAIEERNVAVVTVADNGPRIPRATWEIIKSGQETPMRHAEGIGLWVIYWSISTLGGTIELASNDPRGNKITVKAPLAESSD